MKELSKVIRERKKREEEQRYLSIMEAARKVFFYKGYTKATMDDIAIEAEVSKTVIYKHFKTKDDLFCSLMIPAIERLTATMQGVEEKLLANHYTSGEQLVRDHICGYYGAYKEDPHAFKVLHLFQQTNIVWELDESRRMTIIRKGKRCWEASRRVIDLGKQRGLIRDIDTYKLQDIFWGSAVGIIQTESTKKQPKGLQEHLEPTLELFVDLMVAACVPKKGI